MINLDYVVGFDLETTGVDVLNDRIVTASIVYLDPVGNVIDSWEWLVNPGIEIPEEASNVHGVTTEIAQERGQEPAQAVYEIAAVISYFLNNGVATVAFNAAYDFSLLNSEIVRHLPGYTGLEHFFEGGYNGLKHIIDPYVLDQVVDKYRKGSRTLTATSKVYDIELENAHASYDDCVAAAEIARALWVKHPAFSDATFDEMYEAQIEWFREQKEGLKRHFEKQGKELSGFSTVWPLRTA